MRIPSGLNDESLFGQRNQKSSQRMAYRRLLRLGFALVLVLVLMKQAGNPGAYRIFFPDSDPSVDSLETDDLTTGDDPNSFAQDQHVVVKPSATEVSESELADRDVYDQQLLKQVSDGAIWKKEDQPAFYRLLTDTPVHYLQAGKPRRVGVIQLLQQPEVYLRTRVDIQGRVARVAKITAKENDFEVPSYWELWLQPIDGSDLPVAFYSRNIPKKLASMVDAEYIPAGPVIEIEGVYLKRISFRSTAGNELAPAIIGRVLAPKQAVTSTTAPTAKPEPPSAGLLVMIAAVLGIGVAAAISVASAATAKRMRQARLASQQGSEKGIASLATELEENN